MLGHLLDRAGVKYAARDVVAELDACRRRAAQAEQRLHERRLARAVRPDQRDALAALDDEAGTVEQRLVACLARVQCSASSTSRPLRSTFEKPNASARCGAALSTRSHPLDRLGPRRAWRERVPARNLSTKRCSRSSSACWRSNASACFAIASAFSRRYAEYPIA